MRISQEAPVAPVSQIRRLHGVQPLLATPRFAQAMHAQGCDGFPLFKLDQVVVAKAAETMP